MSARYVFSRRDSPDVATVDPTDLADHMLVQLWRSALVPVQPSGRWDVVSHR